MALAACSPESLRKTNAHLQPESFSSEFDERVEPLLRQMTLEEKIGQITLYTSDRDITGPSVRPEYEGDIRAGRVGAVFNAYTAEFTADLQRLAVEHSRLGIPLLFGYDVVHGYKTIFPIPLGETASWDLVAMERSARIAASEAAAAGLHWTFAPMADVARDPRWGRVAEGAGEDTYLVSAVTAARVKGFQGDNLGSDDSVLACVKHLAAYGAAEGGRDYNTVDISERTLREVYLPPFAAAVDAGAASVMTAFNEIAGVPSTANRWLLQDVLRQEMNFKGFVVSDYTGINELIPHGTAADLAAAAEQAFNAGVDMDMQGGAYQQELSQLVADGKVLKSDVDHAVRRILHWKFKLGLFDDPYKFSNEERERARVLTPDNLEFAREIAGKSIVLLKNADSLLPLSKQTKSIAIIGPLGDDQKELLGSWSGAGDADDVVTLAEGIRAKLSPEAQVGIAKGSEIEGDDSSGFAAAVAMAKKADIIIAAMGESASMSGEAASRSSLALPEIQLTLLKALAKLQKPLILVLMNGRPLVLTSVEEHVPAILETWFLGSQAGHAIADVLFGDVNPSGRLPVSFPRADGQVPIYYNAKNTGRPFAENNKYTSKYLDVASTPLYPFGYGLSYTTFSYSKLQLSRTEIHRNDGLTVLVDVTNTGHRPGLETVQLYITDVVATVTRPIKELRGFKQVLLQPGETKTVSFSVFDDALAYYNLEMQRIVESGRFQIHVGPNSSQLQTLEFDVVP